MAHRDLLNERGPILAKIPPFKYLQQEGKKEIVLGQIGKIFRLHHCSTVVRIALNYAGLSCKIVKVEIEKKASKTFAITYEDESGDEGGGSSESHIKFGGQRVQKHRRCKGST